MFGKQSKWVLIAVAFPLKKVTNNSFHCVTAGSRSPTFVSLFAGKYKVDANHLAGLAHLKEGLAANPWPA